MSIVDSGATKFNGFGKNAVKFLKSLEQNNHKEWYERHKTEFEDNLLIPGQEFVMALGPRLKNISRSIQFAPKVNKSIRRMNRDLRFSKDKRPYKNHFDIKFWEDYGGSCPGSVFFFRLTPGKLVLGVGMHEFPGHLLENFRKIVSDTRKGGDLHQLLITLKKSGFDFGGAELKKVPRGYNPDHPNADLLKHKALYAWKEINPPKELTSPNFVDYCAKIYKNLAPLHLWINKLK